MNGPIKERLAQGGDGADDEAARLFRQLDEPTKRPALSASALDRVQRRLQNSLTDRSPVTRPWLKPALAFSGAIVVGVLGVVIVGHFAVPQIVAAPGAVLPLPSIASSQLVLVGPGVAQVDTRKSAVRLHAGTLVASTNAEPVTLDAPDCKVTVSPRSIVEIDIQSTRVKVASYLGDAMVAWSGKSRALKLEAGSAMSATSPLPIDLAEQRRVETWLGRAPIEPSSPPAVVPAKPVEVKEAAAVSDKTTAKIERTIVSKEDAVVRESRLVNEAVKELRQNSAPQKALKLLDRYEREFPNGTLRPEADTIRVSALLAIGNHAKALARLDVLTLDQNPRGLELFVTRGELREEMGRHQLAIADFDAAKGAQGALRERALYGRGMAQWRSGDRVRAREELKRYLTDFPQGRFANEARKVVESH